MAIATKTDRISTAPIWLRGIIFAVLELVLGIFLLIAPDNVLRIVTIIIGILLVVLGLYSVFRYFSTSPRSAASGTGLSMGLAIFLVGLYLIIRSEAVAAFIIKHLPLLFGIILLLLALDQLQNTVDGIRLKSHFWWIPGIPFVILTTLSLIVFFAKVEDKDIFRFVAILFIVSAVLTLTSSTFGTVITASTDDFGLYSFHGLLPDEYTLRISVTDGYVITGSTDGFVPLTPSSRADVRLSIEMGSDWRGKHVTVSLPSRLSALLFLRWRQSSSML